MGGKIVSDVLLALMQADFLIAAYLRDHLHATEQRRGAIDKGRRAIEGIRHDTVDLEVRMVRFELLLTSVRRVLVWWDRADWAGGFRRPLLVWGFLAS